MNYILTLGHPDMLLIRHPKPLAEGNHSGRGLLKELQRRHQSSSQQVHHQHVGQVYNSARSPRARRSPQGTPGSAQRIPGQRPIVTEANAETYESYLISHKNCRVNYPCLIGNSRYFFTLICDCHNATCRYFSLPII